MSTTATRSPAQRSNGVTSLDAWRKAAIHEITCPTGARVKVKFPDLVSIASGDALPEHLKNAALLELAQSMSGGTAAAVTAETGGAATPGGLSVEQVHGIRELYEWLITETVVEPRITVEDLPRLPSEDKEFLAEIASRQRETDALGVHLGVVPLSRFARFRAAHGCDDRDAGAPCKACEELQNDVSTARVV